MYPRIHLLILVLLGVGPAVFGQPVTAPAVPAPTPATRVQSVPARPPAADERTLELPLRRLINAEDPMILRTSSSVYTIFVPQSPRFKTESLSLHLEFTSSIALITDRSVLRVVFNDVIVSQYFLDRENPSRAVDVEIPVRLLKDGFNRLQFVVAQHYTLKCEDPSAPELYTQIDPDRSYLTATGSFRSVPGRLSFLRWWIDEKLWNTYEFNVVLPGASPMNDLHLTYGAIVTQGVALALNDQPFRVHVSNTVRPGMDNIIIGPVNEVTPFLTATEVSALNGGFLAIKQSPGDPNHCLVIISGRNEQEVGQTALAFGLVNYPLPDSQYATINSLELPPEAAYVRNAPLNLPGIYGFHQLGLPTRTIQGWNTGGYELEVYMPGDISREDQSNAELRLHFTYGAAFRKDSTFNVFINRQFQTAIRLGNQSGAMHSDHRLFLPMMAFQPGRNVVEMVPAMVPLYSDQCQILQDENLLFTLYDDSEFVFPKALRQARLPSLGLFSQTSFPYSAPPDGTETAVYVAGRDEATVRASWTLLGKMAQISGALLHRTEISFRQPPSKKSLLVVGPRQEIPAALVEKAPVSPIEAGRISYLMSTHPVPLRTARSGVEEFIQKIRGAPVENAEQPPPSIAKVNLSAELAEETVAVQFESPVHPGFPVTIFTAGDSNKLLEGVMALQSRKIWNNLKGDVAVWSARPDSLAVAQVGSGFVYKSTSVVTRLMTRFDANPWLMAVVVILVLAALGALGSFVLRRRGSRD